MRLLKDPERDALTTAWLAGGSALPLVQLHVERGEIDDAAAIARLALGRPDCKDAEEIEAVLFRLDDAPAEWDELLKEFAKNPSVERWRELLTFVPDEKVYQRTRNAVRRLRQLGTDPDILFLCACELGMVPDAIELVEEGRVRPDVIAERAKKAGEARATYLGLAAEAAFLRKDIVGAVRLLRESVAAESALCSPLPHIWFIRQRATDEENAMLDQAGIPAVPR